MFDEFVDNTERYEEFIEELLEANRLLNLFHCPIW